MEMNVNIQIELVIKIDKNKENLKKRIYFGFNKEGDNKNKEWS